MQEEEERFAQIIKDSNRKLVILELLSNFFNHKDFVGVLVKTKIIHTLFQNNKALDINKDHYISFGLYGSETAQLLGQCIFEMKLSCFFSISR